MAQKFLCVYHDMIPTLEKLQPAEVGRLILAALKYDATGELPASLPGKEDLIWPMIMAQVDRANASYDAKCETNRQNALKRYDRMRPHATACDGTQYNKNTKQEEDNTKTNTEGVKGKAAAFRPPTLEEVQAYCLERGNGVDPQRFIDYYTSNGWKVGRNAMKDWKAAVRTWERMESQLVQSKPANRNAPTAPAPTVPDQIKKYGNPAEKLAAVQALFGGKQKED